MRFNKVDDVLDRGHLLGSGVQQHNGAIALHFDDAVGSGFEKISEAPVRLDVNVRFCGDGRFGRRLPLLLASIRTTARIAFFQNHLLYKATE